MPWDPGYAGLLGLAEACDVDVAWSCRSGVSRTCGTGVVDGAVASDPAPLEPAAAGHVLICCARPAGPLTVDL